MEVVLQRYEQIQQLKPGNLAPSIGQLMSVEGDTLTLDSFKGKKVLITVWGTWCPFCKEELPFLKELTANHSDSFTSVAISFDQDTAAWRNYVENNNWFGIHLLDAGRKSEFKENYLINGTNAYFLIDENGVIQSERGVKLSTGEVAEMMERLR